MSLRRKVVIGVGAVVVLVPLIFLLWWYRFPEELPADNVLVNPWFEDNEPMGWEYPEWSDAWKGFDVCWSRPHTGWRSACLNVHEDLEMPTAIWGVKQELKPDKFPEYISGYVRADQWEQGTLKMYLQVVVICWLPKPRAGMKNFQVRFLIGGVPRAPMKMKNVRYLVINEDPPKVGEWMPFHLDVGRAFEKKWGYVPREWTKIDVFFEARYDYRNKKDGPTRAKVYYDDLYFGYAK